MKTKHRLNLLKYQKYGEGYNPSINYEEKLLTFVNYGRKETTRPIERLTKSKTYQHRIIKSVLKTTAETRIALCGASIVNGLQRYNNVWNSYFAPLKAANLGIGGDKVQHILWRIEDLELPSSLNYLFLHCGTNNISCSSPRDIADGILSIGIMAKKKLANLKIIIGGLLHCDILPTRTNIVEVNMILRQKVHKLDDFFFMEQDCDWLQDDESLNMEYFIQDGIHLSHRGNEKFANTIIRKLKYIESLSPSSSSGIILRIPSCEAPQKVASGASSVLSPKSSVLSLSPVVCQSSQSSSHHVSSHRPLFTKVPKAVYDHHERLLALSSPFCVSSSHCRPRHQQHRSPHRRRLSPRSPSCHRSQPPSLPVLLPDGSDRGDGSGCDASPSSPSSWSFVSFLIMVFSTISLPITTLSYHFASFIWSLSCHMPSLRHRQSHTPPLSSQHHSSQSRHTPPSSPSNRSYSYRSSLRSPMSSLIWIPLVLFLFLYAFFVLSLLTNTLTAEKVEDTDLPSSNPLVSLKAFIFLISFTLRILINLHGMRFSSIHNESRYFIRKRLKFRKPKKVCSDCHIFLLNLLFRRGNIYINSSPNGDFLQWI